jgi:hypothetical protein
MDLKAKYADKIAKLLNLAENTPFPEEAETFTARAQELMAQYAIDEAMIEAARGISGESAKIVREEFVFIGIYRFPLADLGHRVLKVNDCQVIQMAGKNWREIDGKVYKETVVYKAVGYKGDIDRARVLVTSLMLQAITAETAWWAKNKELYKHEKKGGHYSRRQFLFSFSHAVHKRLKEAKEKGRATANKEHGGDSVALVLRDKSLAVRDEFTKMYPHTRKSGASYSAGDAFAGEAGRAAGEKADIGGTKLGGPSRKQLN